MVLCSIRNTYLMSTFASENILSRLMLGLAKSSNSRACNTILNHQIKIMPHLDNPNFVIRSNCRVRTIWAYGTWVQVRVVLHLEVGPIPLEANCMKFQFFFGLEANLNFTLK
jgi:hypothetical protein